MKFSKGVIAIYHDINYEARSMEVLACMEQLCETCVYVSYVAPKYPHKASCVTVKNDKLRYYRFLAAIKRTIKREKPDAILLHDDMCAPILRFLKKHHFAGRVIVDSSELYTLENQSSSIVSHIKSMIRWAKYATLQNNIKIEKKYLRFADAVLAANKERATYMRTYFELSTTPYVYDNVHRIDDVFDEAACSKKFDQFFEAGRFHILYAGGIAAKRRTYELVKAAVAAVQDGIPVTLLIAGRTESAEKERIDALLCKQGETHIQYLGYLSRAELRYLFQRSEASVSAFSKDTLNNLYCSSGKVYESLFEGVPILTSDNPPLKRLCEEECVGVSNDDFLVGIRELYENYEKYRSGAETFATSYDYETRVPQLVALLTENL